MRPYLAPPAERPAEPSAIPSFSVVIPVYEAAHLVGRAVESALDQTVSAVDVIVSDDGSTDELEAALAPYRDRIVLLRGPHAGPPVARNRGFRAATGDFVANLDADDMLGPEWIEALGELAGGRPDLDILTSDSYLVHEGARLRRCYGDGWTFAVDDQRGAILDRSFLTSISAVRRSRYLKIGGFDEAIPWCDDWDLWVRLILDGSRVGCVNQPLAEYEIRPGSISTRRIDVLRGGIRLLEKAQAAASLRPDERGALAVTIAAKRRDLARLEARESIVRRERGARRKALAVALDAGQPVPTRLKTGAATILPGVGRRLLGRRDGDAWLGAGGTRVRPPLRVAFYCDSNDLGGAELSMANLIATLDPSFRTAVLGTSPRIVDTLTSRREGVESHELPRIRGEWDVPAIAAHFQAIRRFRPDILHVSLNSPGASPWGILCGLAAPGVKVVAVEQLPQRIPRLRRRALKRLTTPRLAALVAVGGRSADTAAQLAGVDRASVRTIYNGVPDLDLELLPRPAEGPVVGTIGRLDAQKGYDVLVRALAGLPGVTAVVVGDGPEREPLDELARELGVADRLLITGWSDEARRHLTTFDLFVLPSRHEGFPLVIVEAMLARLAVVATDVGSVAEAVVDGETGVLVPPENPEALASAVRMLIADPARRRELGGKGRERALQRFTAAAMAREYAALYDEVVR